MVLLAEVCPRRRQTKECVTAHREGQGEKTLAAVRHDVEHARRPYTKVGRTPTHSIYRNIELGMV